MGEDRLGEGSEGLQDCVCVCACVYTCMCVDMGRERSVMPY